MQNETVSPIAYSHMGQRVTAPVISHLMQQALQVEGMLSLAAGFTDNSTLPSNEVLSALNALNESTSDAEHYQYGTTLGRPGLRQEILTLISSYQDEKHTCLDRQNVLITNGSQQALYLAMQAICNPGDIVLVERPSYFVFLEMLKGLGIQIETIPTKDDGCILWDELEGLLETIKKRGDAAKLKAVYLVSYFSNPSSRSLSKDSKVQIALHLKSADLAPVIIEDAAYRELYFAQPAPSPSILSLPEYKDFPLLYAGTFTKPFATGLKVGFCISNRRELLNILCHIKGHHDFGTANTNQAILERFLESGSYPAFLETHRKYYQHKMEVLHTTLHENGLAKAGWKWKKPEGGLLMWLQAPNGLDTRMESIFCKSCLEQKVLYVPGDLCFGNDVPHHFVRLSFGALPEDKLVMAAKRFAAVAVSFSS